MAPATAFTEGFATITDFLSHLNTTQWHRVALGLLVACMGIGLGVGFAVASNQAKDAADADYNRRFAIFSDWQVKLSSRFSEAQSLAATIAAFAMNNIDEPIDMSWNKTQKQRVVGLPGAYARLSRGLFRDVPGITSLTLCPGGIVSQTYSSRNVSIGSDIYPSYKPVWDKMMVDGLPAVTGPRPLASRPGIAVNTWYPIFANDTTSPATFWGASLVVMEVADLLRGMHIDELPDKYHMHYVMWYETTIDDNKTIVAFNKGAPNATVMTEGMLMELPVGEEGRTSYLAMYPFDGNVSEKMATEDIIAIIVATVLGAFLLTGLWYALLLCYFMYRHRNAPSTASHVYIAAVTLRGAQPIADRAPLDAVRIFAEFVANIREKAVRHKCYPICEIGDRCLYVAATNPNALLSLARHCAADVTIMAGRPVMSRPGTAARSVSQSAHRSRTATRSVSHSRDHRTAGTPSHHKDDGISTSHISDSSFMATTACHPSVACHVAMITRVYDATRDVYFYGSANTLTRLCSALDMTRSGEVAWTDPFENVASDACRGMESAALATNAVSADDVTIHVASWWRETGDERDNEDPSTAMAILNDAYVRRMTVIVSNGRTRGGAGGSKGKGSNGGSKDGRSDKSAEATAITRNATLLHIAVTGDIRAALNIIRKVVSDERGTVVAAHENTIVAAFNLLSPCGQHQLRAAVTVGILRAALPCAFVSSIHHGKVHALIAEGLVMCTGEVATIGRALLERALTLAPPSLAYVKPAPLLPSPTNNNGGMYSNMSTPTSRLTRTSSLTTLHDPSSMPVNNNSTHTGLCVLHCYDEVAAHYDCEAIDLLEAGGTTTTDPDAVVSMTSSLTAKGRIVYRLADQKAAKATCDEWMYELKEDEDGSMYATVNAIFARLLEGERDEARRLWEALSSAPKGHASISQLARARLEALLKPAVTTRK